MNSHFAFVVVLLLCGSDSLERGSVARHSFAGYFDELLASMGILPRYVSASSVLVRRLAEWNKRGLSKEIKSQLIST